MTPEFFSRQMDRLVGLKFRPPDLETHWEALCDLPDVALETAVSRAQRTRVDFPSPVELRQDADQSAQKHVDEDDSDRKTALEVPIEIPYPLAAAVIPVRETWRYDCDDCSDTGWQSVWCGQFTVHRKPWQEPRTCERRGSHGSHEWARVCLCSERNPTLIRRREAQRKYADQSEKKKWRTETHEGPRLQPPEASAGASVSGKLVGKVQPRPSRGRTTGGRGAGTGAEVSRADLVG